MNQSLDITVGESLVDYLEDSSGAVDLTGATVVLQTRVDCGDITERAASVTGASIGEVTVSGIPGGSYKTKWKVTIAGVVSYYPAAGWDTLYVRAVDACNTFELFSGEIKETVWPEGEAENLLANHRRYIVDALIDLQQKIPSARIRHRDRVYQVNTFLECHATVTDAPRGFIARVSTITADGCCPPRDAEPIDHDLMACILKDNSWCGDITVPYDMYLYGAGYIAYPDYGCLYYADSSGQTDKTFRPCDRVVSIDQGRLYLYPHLQSNEILVIEWDGIKRSWNDGDEISFDREIQDAAEHFLAAKTAYREAHDRDKMAIERGMYDSLVAKLIWRHRQENRIPQRRHCFSNCNPYSVKRIING